MPFHLHALQALSYTSALQDINVLPHCVCTLLLCLQEDIRACRFDCVPVIDVHDPPSYKIALDFTSSKYGRVCPGYITGGRLESILCAYYSDMMREAEGKEPVNFEYADEKIKVGCCVCTPCCVLCTGRRLYVPAGRPRVNVQGGPMYSQGLVVGRVIACCVWCDDGAPI
jgi:hypothetical protein